MKKLLFFILFTGSLLGFSGSVSAQSSIREPYVSQKSDDGVLVAYPNPAKDFIVLKAKDSMQKVKSVTFYSILGVQVLYVNVNMSNAEINLDRLRPGKYLMMYVMSDNTKRVTQIIKQ